MPGHGSTSGIAPIGHLFAAAFGLDGTALDDD